MNFWSADGYPGWSADGRLQWTADGSIPALPTLEFDPKWVVTLEARLWMVSLSLEDIVALTCAGEAEVMRPLVGSAVLEAREYKLNWIPDATEVSRIGNAEVSRIDDPAAFTGPRNFTVSWQPTKG